MPAQPNRIPNIAKVFISVIVMTFSCVFFTGSAEAQTTWLITVDVSSGSDTPTYTIQNTTGGNGDTCDASHPTNDGKKYKGDIYVCPQDTIFWTAVTKNGSDGKMHHHMIIREEDDILDKVTGGDSSRIFHAREGAHDGGPIDGICSVNDSCQGKHEYSVFIFDKTGPELYVHDPKIIIGGTTVDDEIVKLEKTLVRLCDEIIADPRASKSQKELAKTARNQIDEIKKRKK
jgi:hypothetical protein